MSELAGDERTLPGLLDVSDGLADHVREALGRFERVAGWPPRRLQAELALGQRRLSVIRADGRSTRHTASFFVKPERRVELYAGAFDGLSDRFAPAPYLLATLLHELAHVWDEASQFALASGLLVATGGVWQEPTYMAGPRGAPAPVTTRSGRVDPYEDFAESVACVLVGDRYLDAKQGMIDPVRHRYVRDLFAAPRSRERAVEVLGGRTPKAARNGRTHAAP